MSQTSPLWVVRLNRKLLRFRMVRLVVVLTVTSLILLSPRASFADDVQAQSLSEEISMLLTFGNESTTVQIEQCTLQISTVLRTTCTRSREAKIDTVTIKIAEVKGFELRPFQERFVWDIELDVPKPPRLQTIFNHHFRGKNAAFETFSDEMGRLLEESDIETNRTIGVCDGTTYVRKERNLMLFFDDTPQNMSYFDALVDQCQP